MSNLGAYQLMTTLAKKVGGPLVLAAIAFIGGYVIIRGVEGGIKSIVRKKNLKNVIENKYKDRIFDVIISGKERGGPEFQVGDKIRILVIDHEAVLIEKLEDGNNPYFVSRALITAITGIDIV